MAMETPMGGSRPLPMFPKASGPMKDLRNIDRREVDEALGGFL